MSLYKKKTKTSASEAFLAGLNADYAKETNPFLTENEGGAGSGQYVAGQGINITDNVISFESENISQFNNDSDFSKSKIFFQGRPYFAGDSITFGNNATNAPGSISYVNRVGAHVGDFTGYPLSVTNLGVGGFGVVKCVSSMFANVKINNSSTGLFMAGLNDIRRSGDNPKTFLKIAGCYRSAIANHFLQNALPASLITNNGTWSNIAPFVGNAIKLGGVMRQSSTINDTLTWINPYYGNSLVIGTVNTDGVTYDYGRFEVIADGVSLGIFDPNNRTDNIFDGYTDNGRTPEVIIYNNLQFTNLTIKVLDNKPTVIDYVGVLKSTQNSAGFMALSAPRLNAIGYAEAPAGANDALIEQVGQTIEDVVTQFIETNYPVVFIEVNDYYDVSTGISSDNIHPNGPIGHRQIAEAIIAKIGVSNRVGGPDYFLTGEQPRIIIADLAQALGSQNYMIQSYNGSLWFSRTNDTVTGGRLTKISLNTDGTVSIGKESSNGAQLNLPAGTANFAQLDLPVSVAPSTPVDGNIWREDNTNTGLKIRVNGITKTITLS